MTVKGLKSVMKLNSLGILIVLYPTGVIKIRICKKFPIANFISLNHIVKVANQIPIESPAISTKKQNKG